MTRSPVVLTIAGVDPSGGAGVYADLKTITANGAYGISVVTAITSQNLNSLRDILYIPASTIKSQLETLHSQFEIDAIKIGMVGTLEALEVIIEFIDKIGTKVVLDPIIHASSGSDLIQKDAIKLLKSELFKRAYLITPNLPEAFALSSLKTNSLEGLKEIALNLQAENVLIKGGHSNEQFIIDLLLQEGKFYEFKHKRVDGDFRGTGCSLSSAIATNIAFGNSLLHACENSISYIQKSMKKSFDFDASSLPLDHFYFNKKELCV